MAVLHPYWVLVARLALGFMWAVAGAAKLVQPKPLTDAVDRFRLLPRRAARLVGMVLPWTEVALGVMLLAGVRTKAAASVSAALLVLFTVAIAVNLLLGRRVRCHCFGQANDAPISWWSVLRNVVLLTAALLVAVRNPAHLSVDGWLGWAAPEMGAPAAANFVPVSLMTVAGALLCALAVGIWEVGRALALATQGPAVQMPERRLALWLATRRWGAARRAHASHAEEGR